MNIPKGGKNKFVFDTCIIQDPLPCSSLKKLLSDKFVPVEHIAMLQIDIEGYEYILLDGMLKEMPDSLHAICLQTEEKTRIRWNPKSKIKKIFPK